MEIKCSEFVKERKEALKKEISWLKSKNIYPKLVVVNTGNDPASKSYINSKLKVGEELGVNVQILEYASISQASLLEVIDELNADKLVHGIIVQLPLLEGLDKETIINRIDPKKDVDCLTQKNYAKFLASKSNDVLAPCTPKGIYNLLKWMEVDFNHCDAVIVNRSDIVGKPLFNLLLNANATVTVCHSKSKDIKSFTKRADLIVLGVGQRDFLKFEDVKENSIIIDVSINRDEKNKLKGDAQFDLLVNKAQITPVPRGIGPITVVTIFENLMDLINEA